MIHPTHCATKFDKGIWSPEYVVPCVVGRTWTLATESGHAPGSELSSIVWEEEMCLQGRYDDG